MNRMLFANKLARKVLIIIFFGAATLILNLKSEAEPLAGLKQNTVLTGLDHDEPTKPRLQPRPEQAHTVTEHQHAETTITDDDQRCVAICWLPEAASDKE